MLNEQSFFDVLSDETRRRILSLILREGELCVCELFFALNLPQPKVSRHLGVMREAQVLSVRRDGTWVFYRLHSHLPLWAAKVIEAMTHGIEHSPQYQDDEKQLALMTNRPVKCCA